MTPRRVLALGLATQGALIVIAWAASAALDLPPYWGQPARDSAIGVVAAFVLATLNYVLLVHAPRGWVIDGVRLVYETVLLPLFARMGPTSIVLLGVAAGVGEEWLFRGVVQPVLGLVAASLLFGAAHVGGRHMLAFGVWASAMGLLLGVLASATGGLLAPMVAHGLYDILALQFIRRGAQTA